MEAVGSVAKISVAETSCVVAATHSPQQRDTTAIIPVCKTERKRFIQRLYVSVHPVAAHRWRCRL